jgi:metallo-beta-lactamase class B
MAPLAGHSAEPPAKLPPPPDRNAVKVMFDAWRAPVPPRHLLANIYYVGATGVSSYLITTPEGHILLDTGFDDTVPIIRRSVEQLGFKLTDIKFILSSHAHIDHVGGHALMKKLTGAQILASAADARTIESGGDDDFIPLPKDTTIYTPVKVDRIVAEGERVTLGGVTLTAFVTPGHTRGATTWTMDVTDEGRVRHGVFLAARRSTPARACCTIRSFRTSWKNSRHHSPRGRPYRAIYSSRHTAVSLRWRKNSRGSTRAPSRIPSSIPRAGKS